MSNAVLDVERLTVSLPRGADRPHAVSDLSVQVMEGQLLCLVGESGSGKSITAHTVMGLLPSNLRATAGRIRFDGEDVLQATPQRLRQLRGEKMSIIFQEPLTALNPVMTCGAQIDELLVEHTRMSGALRRARVLDMLDRVRLHDPPGVYRSYPHQLSGGQRQRIMIAMALILKPRLLIADEPTTALDVTTQAEILKLIRDLQAEDQTAVLFITHDFGVVADIADTVAVLKLGQLVESGPAQDVLRGARHAYTRMLLQCVPSLTPRQASPTLPHPIQLRARRLRKVFESGGWFRRARRVTAVDGVDLEVFKGETLGVVGESGSGKSTLARLLMRLIEPSEGDIELNGQPVSGIRREDARGFRRKVQMIFQDPYRSLNPRRTVGAAITEGPLNFGVSKANAWKRAAGLMSLVQLESQCSQPLSARVFGRSTPTHLHCARPGPRARGADRRRGSVGARRVDPGADPGAAPGDPRAPSAHDSLHHPRLASCGTDLRSGDRDAVRQGRGGGSTRGSLSASPTRIHACAAASRSRAERFSVRHPPRLIRLQFCVYRTNPSH